MAKKEHILATEPVDKLVTLVEEATRATSDSPRRFIEPARGTLDRAKSRRHHLIFGRRGSGKTSLLRRASADLTLRRIPTSFVDLEAFKGHNYPDVLLSVLIETFRAFDGWLETAGTNPATKKTFWRRFFGEKPSRPPLNRKRVKVFREKISGQISDLERLLHSEEGAEIQETIKSALESEESGGSSGKLSAEKAKISASIGGQSAKSLKMGASAQVVETRKRQKLNFLHRHIIEYQRLFSELVSLSESDAYIFLDDLYHIASGDQANVLDYFHRIIKNRSVWLKVGTIRHRTEWYRHGDPPIGIKLGDDCDDIDLDITLEKYGLARKFLLQILDQLITEVGLGGHKTIISDGGVQRLVLGSGGVARDFLTIFRRSVDIARERGITHRGPKISAEDVNLAAGEHDTSKRDELNRDTHGERQRLERALLSVQRFCVANKMNCFLVERDLESAGMDLIGELVDLRFLHVVATRTSVRRREGKLFSAYMLDISQYTGERRRREMTLLSFWKREEFDKLRLTKFIFDLQSLEAEAESG